MKRIFIILLSVMSFSMLCGFTYKSSDFKFTASDVATPQGVVIPKYSEVLRLSDGLVQYKAYYLNVDDSQLRDYNDIRDEFFTYGVVTSPTKIIDNGSGVVFVGDSRISMMIDDNTIGAISDKSWAGMQNSISWIAKGGADMSWLCEVACPTLNNSSSYKGKTVVISMGVNDLLVSNNTKATIDAYKNMYYFLAENWKECKLCVTTVNPIQGEKNSTYNLRIEQFNNMIRNELPDSITVIDGCAACDTVIPRYYKDFVHFDTATSLAMEQFYYTQALSAAKR